MPKTINGPSFEEFVENQFDQLGIHYETQYQASGINKDFSRIDIVTLDEFETPLEAISLKYQNDAGTADEKVCFEAYSLSLMCQVHNISQATIVLAGPGWSEAKLYWYLHEFKTPSNVRIISYNQFEQEYIAN